MSNNLLTINQITKEAIRLFNNNNLFIKNLDSQYVLQNNVYVPSAPAIISLKEAIVLGAAAALIKNPEITRRFWSGWSK